MHFSKEQDSKPRLRLQVAKNQLRLYDCNHVCGYCEKIQSLNDWVVQDAFKFPDNQIFGAGIEKKSIRMLTQEWFKFPWK